MFAQVYNKNISKLLYSNCIIIIIKVHYNQAKMLIDKKKNMQEETAMMTN